VRHADVHQHDVGARLAGQAHGLLAVAGLAHDGQTWCTVDDHGEAVPEQGLVVGQDDPDGRWPGHVVTSSGKRASTRKP
jgi:hypothetical protein